jgi:hypothetical protein
MADAGEMVDVLVSTIAEGSARVGGGIEDPAIAKALAEKASIAALRRQRKDDRLRKEADSAKKKALHQTQGVEDSSRKRAREKETISFYFRRSCNFDPDETSGGVTGRSPLTGSGLDASTAPESHAPLQGSASLDAASIAAAGVTSSDDVEVIGGRSLRLRYRRTPLFIASPRTIQIGTHFTTSL